MFVQDKHQIPYAYLFFAISASLNRKPMWLSIDLYDSIYICFSKKILFIVSKALDMLYVIYKNECFLCTYM